MNGSSLAVFLKDQNTGTFCKIRIIFDHDSIGNACKNISNQNIVLSQFIVPMSRDKYFASFDKFEDFLKRFAHVEDYTTFNLSTTTCLNSSCTDSHF